MAFKSSLIDRYYFVRWELVEPRDTATILRDVAQARERVGQPLIYVAIAAPDAPAPDDEGRQALVRMVDPLMKHCERACFVVGGAGMKGSIQRTVASGIFLVAGKRGLMSTHAKVEQAIGGTTPLQGTTQAVLRRAIEAGLCDG